MSASQQQIDRQKRFTSHALVEIRKYKWLPLGIHSAVLLDMSLGGFKVEFTGNDVASAGSKYWIQIPLAPLKIAGPSHLSCRMECRWFDEKLYRLGGVFIDLTEQDKIIIAEIVNSLSSRGGFSL